MSKVLYIQSSPCPGRSHSIEIADAFVEAYKKANPDDEVMMINLFEKELPTFDGFKLDAKYKAMHGKKHTPAEKAAWDLIVELIDEFKSFDKYVFAVPMWNFGIPYRLKQYLDIIIQPGQSFSYSPDEGYKGLITSRSVFISYARGGQYPVGSEYESMDFQKPYLELALGFIGLTDVKSVVIEPTLMAGPDTAKAKVEEAVAEAKDLARNF